MTPGRQRLPLLAASLALVLPAPVEAAGATDPAGREAVVRAWSKRLNAGDDDGAARLFRLPAVIVQTGTLRIRTHLGLAAWHAQLPCAGTISSIVVQGRFATARLRLRDGYGSRCDSRGVVVAVRFEIVGGKIASWVQLPWPP